MPTHHSKRSFRFFTTLFWPAARGQERTHRLLIVKRKKKDRLAAALSEIRLDLLCAAAQRYAFRKASKSALIVAASVVGIPCGKFL